MRTLLRQSLSPNQQPLQWRRALRVAIATSLPLLIAILHGTFQPAVYGAVAGLYTMLVDNGGAISQRIMVMVYMTVGMLLCGIAGYVDHWVPGAPLAFLLAISLLTGWLQGTGNAVEMMGKFWLIAFLFGDSNPNLSPLSGTYLLLGGLAGVLSVGIDRILTRRPEKQFGPMLFEGISRILRRRHSNSRYALYFASTVLVGYTIAYGLGLTRAYWVPLTIIMVTVYDPQHSIVRLFQRLLGTLLGASIGGAVLYWCHHEVTLLFIVMLLSATTGLVWRRNYWMGVTPFTALVLVFLDFGSREASPLLALARVENTMLGCVIAGLGALIYLRLCCHKKPRQTIDRKKQ